MLEFKAHSDVTMGSEKGFGFTIGAVFIILAVFGVVTGGWYWVYALGVGAVFAGFAAISPGALRVPNRLWFRFGQLLHSVMSPVLMFVVFVTVFLPTGLIFRLRGKDLLNQKFNKTASSYWEERTEPPTRMSRQF